MPNYLAYWQKGCNFAPKMQTDAIRLEHLTIGYDAKHPIATDINCTLSAGELTCLVGANGVGKSTLLKTIAGLVPAIGSRVESRESRVESRESRGESNFPKRLNDQTTKRLISVVLTGRTDVQNLTVEEVVGLGRTPYTNFWGTLKATDRQVVAESMETVGITALKDRAIHELSDGEHQKVMVAKALAQQTPVILLDEPTAFLDHPSRIAMFELLQRLAHEEGKAILLSTHDLEIAVRYADIFWVMEKEKGLSIVEGRELRVEGRE